VCLAWLHAALARASCHGARALETADTCLAGTWQRLKTILDDVINREGAGLRAPPFTNSGVFSERKNIELVFLEEPCLAERRHLTSLLTRQTSDASVQEL